MDYNFWRRRRVKEAHHHDQIQNNSGSSLANRSSYITNIKHNTAAKPGLEICSLICEICSDRIDFELLDYLTDRDWDNLWGQLLRHKVAPVFLKKLSDSNYTIPDILSEKVRVYKKEHTLKAMRHSAELVHLTRIFTSEDIRLLFFKGQALVHLFDIDIQDRHCGDIDVLLVDFNDLLRANEILLTLGYERLSGLTERVLQSREALQFFNIKDIGYFHPENHIHIELHFSLFLLNLLPYDNERFHNRRSEITIAGNSVPVMCREDHVIYLLVHGSISGWYRLKWLLDIPIVSNGGISYMNNDNKILTEKLGIERITTTSLCLANKFLQMPISQNNAKMDFISSKLVYRHAFKNLQAESIPLDYPFLAGLAHAIYRNIVYKPMLKKELRHKLQCLTGPLVSARDYNTVPLPPALFWLYYPLRPVLWILRRVNLVK